MGRVVGLLTRAISQIILLALYSILQILGFTTSLLYPRLHGLWRHIVRHVDVVVLRLSQRAAQREV